MKAEHSSCALLSVLHSFMSPYASYVLLSYLTSLTYSLRSLSLASVWILLSDIQGRSKSLLTCFHKSHTLAIKAKMKCQIIPGRYLAPRQHKGEHIPAWAWTSVSQTGVIPYTYHSNCALCSENGLLRQVAKLTSSWVTDMLFVREESDVYFYLFIDQSLLQGLGKF